MTLNTYVVSLRKTMTGIIGVIIASTLTGIAGVSAIGLSPFSINIKINISSNFYPALPVPRIITHLSEMASLIMLIMGVVRTVGGFLFLVFTLGYIVPGFRSAMQHMRTRYETQLKLLTIGLPIIGGAEILYGITAVYLSRTLQSFLSSPGRLISAVWILGIFTAIALLGRLIGYIGMGWLNLDLYNRFNEGFMLAAAILFFITIPFNIVGFIAWILELVAVHQLMTRQPLLSSVSHSPTG